VLARCREGLKTLDGLRVKLDDSVNQTAGWKYNQYEMLGVPVRVEIGPKDVEKQGAVLVPRDGSGKRFIKFADLRAETTKLLDEVHERMFAAALKRLESATSEAADFGEFQKKIEANPGFIRVAWCGTQECENRIIDETKTTPRVMVQNEQGKAGRCIACGKETSTVIHYARTY